MRKELVLSVAVGRGMPVGFATFHTCPKTTLAVCERRADAAEDSKLRELVKAGYAPERVAFTRDTHDAPDAPVLAVTPAPLGVDVQAIATAAAEAVAKQFAGQLAAQQAEIDALRAAAKAKSAAKRKTAAKAATKKGAK